MSGMKKSIRKSRIVSSVGRRPIPSLLAPEYHTKNPNDSIELYRGTFDLISNNSTQKSIDGTFQLDWGVSPKLYIQSNQVNLSPSSNENPEFNICIPSLGWDANGFVVQSNDTNGQFRGLVTNKAQQSRKGLSQIVFHVPNIPSFHGYAVATQSGWKCARISLTDDEWKVHLESVENISELITNLNKRGGFALTATGLIERKDGQCFNSETSKELLEQLYWFLSFVWGRRTGPMLLVGRDQHENVIWRRWEVSRVSSWSTDLRFWMPQGEPTDIRHAFPGFSRRFKDPIWKRTLELSIHWYVEALRQSGAVEGSIIMIQAAFERIWWTIFVANGAKIRDSNKIIAADKLRMILSHYKIPADIPNELSDLHDYARKTSWEDGPTAITRIRNAIVHPPKSNSNQNSPPGMIISETWELAVWYLEMVLLAAIEYNGVYNCRLNRRGNAMDVKTLPWT